MPFADYLREAVLEPLGLTATLGGRGRGSSERCRRAPPRPGGARADAHRRRDAGRGDDGAVPGPRGGAPRLRQADPNDWGLGFELRDAKSPHWTTRLTSPRTFGHFGSKPGSATFLWVDPERELASRRLPTIRFGSWASPPGRSLGRDPQRRKSSRSRLSWSGRSRLGRWPAPSIVSRRAPGISAVSFGAIAGMSSTSSVPTTTRGVRRPRRAVPRRGLGHDPSPGRPAGAGARRCAASSPP